MKIAVLGMGRMGRALAGRLMENGHEVTVWNRSPGKAPELVEKGASEAKSAQSAVTGAEMAITSLANDAAVRDVAWGDEGIRSALPQGSVYVEASTISPALSEELNDGFPRFAAMPILGSPSQVAAGQAMYLIGAEESVAKAIEPLFPGLSEKTFRYDKPSVASSAKVAVNLLLLDGVVALAESFAVGRAGGLTDDQLRELLGNSPMVAPGLKYRFEGILTGEQETFWTTVLGAKDAGLALDLAKAASIDLPVTRTARDLYEEAASSDDSADIASVSRHYRR
jgi:3-hydroxyisobutyrate dehydrogenase-like beta-hydroxyacid dehydrogenase